MTSLMLRLDPPSDPDACKGVMESLSRFCFLGKINQDLKERFKC